MARKKYKLTASVIASPSYADQGNTYPFRVGFQKQLNPLILCGSDQCPLITIDATTVMGTDNPWAQRCLDEQLIPGGIFVNGVNFFGTPIGGMALEETTDAETLDLDTIFPTTP
jgi:hypothetical protein